MKGIRMRSDQKELVELLIQISVVAEKLSYLTPGDQNYKRVSRASMRIGVRHGS